jgi:hypothetical protein
MSEATFDQTVKPGHPDQEHPAAATPKVPAQEHPAPEHAAEPPHVPAQVHTAPAAAVAPKSSIPGLVLTSHGYVDTHLSTTKALQTVGVKA